MSSASQNRLASRKLWVTIGTVVLIAALDLAGHPLSQESTTALVELAAVFLGAQGLVDVSTAWKAGTVVAELGRAAKDSASK